MFKRIVSIIMSMVFVLILASCGKADPAQQTSVPESTELKTELPQYEDHQFIIAGLWAPKDVSEEGYQLYKDAGFTALSFSNHDEMPRTSDNQYYLGSNRTMEALKLCKKVGLDALLGYGDNWYVRDIEGQDYFDGTPFSNYDYYGDYKDIIKAFKMKDEPSKEDVEKYMSDTLIEDFKKVYPNAQYFMTITPKHASPTAYGFDSYDDMLEFYGENIMSKFENPLIEVDFYPFPNEENRNYPRWDDWVITYEAIANTAKKYNGDVSIIMQSSAGLEFAEDLTESDMRMQVNMALAFGAKTLKYYCYTVPTIKYTYNYCILDPDNKPSALYGYVKDIHKEIQSFANVILSYKWDSVIGVNPVGFSSNMDMSKLLLENEFTDTKHFVHALSSTDLIMSRFVSEKHGEAYMLVNYAQKDAKNNVVTLTLKDCKKVAVYGGKGFDGTPKIIELDNENKCRFEFEYGEGAFIVPLA